MLRRLFLTSSRDFSIKNVKNQKLSATFLTDHKRLFLFQKKKQELFFLA